MAARPTSREAADRALLLYAFVRRGAIEHVVDDADADPSRLAQAERARVETDRWLAGNDLEGALDETEARLLAAESGLWPPEAIADALWRREALGALLWALGHLERIPPYDTEFDQRTLDSAIVGSGSVEHFRAMSELRDEDDLRAALHEADAWHGATAGAEGDEAPMASLSAERRWALSWLLGDA